MNVKHIRPILSVAIVLMFTMVAMINLPLVPVIPQAHAIGGASALLGLWNEQRHSSAIIDSSIGNGGLARFDINVTNAGNIKGFDIVLNYTTSILTFSNSSISGVNCPVSAGCVFAGIPSSFITKINQTSSTGYRLSIVDTCTTTCSPTVSGTGILFRLVLKGTSTRGSTAVHIKTSVSIIENPGSVPYQAIDGYFDNSNTPLFNYNISVSPTSTTVLRTISGTNTSSSISLTVNGGTGSIISLVTFSALGLPRAATISFSSASCTPNPSCAAITFTITVHGGPAANSGTTPSGTFPIAIIGNSTVSGKILIKEDWLSLVVNPPHAPTYTLFAPQASSSTKFTQEAGGPSTVFNLNATLLTGANDTLTESGTDCLQVGLTCTISPSSGSFAAVPKSLYSTLTVKSDPSTSAGPRQFNVTATTSGTYSEEPVVVFLTFTATIARTHDLSVSGESISRTFSYAGVSLSGNPIKLNATVSNLGTVTESSFNVNGTVKASLAQDLKIGFVDANFNGAWDSGETVTYDTNGDFTYNTGEPTISGSAPSNGTPLSFDLGTRFFDSNFNVAWNTGETVVYDTNGNGLFDAGEANIAGTPLSPGVLLGPQTVSSLLPIEPVLNGAALANGTSLIAADPKIKFSDIVGSGAYLPGQPLAYDSDNNGLFTYGKFHNDTMITGTLPNNTAIVPVDSKVRYVDTNTSTSWTCNTLASLKYICQSGEPVVYDRNSDGKYFGSSKVVTINFDPGSLARGSYRISVAAIPVASEFQTGNNKLTLVSFTQRLKGDVNGDCKVDIVDLASVGSTFGKSAGQAGFNPAADLNNSGVIDIVDLVLVASVFGQTC